MVITFEAIGPPHCTLFSLFYFGCRNSSSSLFEDPGRIGIIETCTTGLYRGLLVCFWGRGAWIEGKVDQVPVKCNHFALPVEGQTKRKLPITLIIHIKYAKLRCVYKKFIFTSSLCENIRHAQIYMTSNKTLIILVKYAKPEFMLNQLSQIFYFYSEFASVYTSSRVLHGLLTSSTDIFFQNSCHMEETGMSDYEIPWLSYLE